MKVNKTLKSLGMKEVSELGTDAWYDYLINDYIPKQGTEDMNMFISLGFDPYSYTLWKAFKNGLLKEPLAEAFKARIKEVYNIDI